MLRQYTLLLPLCIALATSHLTGPAQARDAGLAPVPAFEVAGGDFPLLIRPTGTRAGSDAEGNALPPGCESLRAKRVDELFFPWNRAIERVHVDCQPMDATEDENGNTSGKTHPPPVITATAYLRAGHVRLAGHAVVEIRLIDSGLWSDRQYVIANRFDNTVTALQEHVEARCRQQARQAEREDEDELCRMIEAIGARYLPTHDLGGIWLYPDPDDPEVTLYAEVWAE